MIKFAHVGFPKCASTWLQSEVFSQHNDIYFLGRRPGDKIITDEIRTLFWSTMLDAREFAYNKKETQEILVPYLLQAREEKKKAIGLSLEQLLHPQIGRLELGERARRLYDFMGQSTKIIIVIREQEAWIRSYYSNLVSEAGLPATFGEFKRFFFAESEISPLSTLYYDRIFEVYSEFFGEENVFILPMEQLRESETSFSNVILQFIGLPPVKIRTGQKRNVSANNELFAAQWYLNNENNYRLGRSTAIYRAFGWQARSIYSERSDFDLPEKYKEDQKHYMRSWGIEKFLKDNPEIKDKLEPLDRKFSEIEKEMIKGIYKQSNQRLENLSGLELSKYGYAT